ncbi:RNA-guided endonuclease InsQ/TnpB family protein [Parabacteroides goldsteinii]|uniref:RNA-guided endonuclease InsQ/TnpB family protein n=1 Tax=Parabacteroides goldsteinii TaxID=328812 RepID=UPI00256ED3A7|nr:transposase [Parabacteroides goldsteinii]
MNLNYYSLEKKLRAEDDIDYRALPAPVAQQVLMMVDRNFKSFFNLLNKKGRGEYSEKVRMPKYLNKDGMFTAVFTTTAFSQKWIKQGVVKLPKQFSFTTRTNKKNIQQLRFVPKKGYIVLEIVYNKKEKDLMPDNGNYLGVDIGLDNLASCVSNNGSCFIINGRPLKSINQYYNKKLAYLKSKLKDNRQVSKQIISLMNKRNNKIKDYLRKASRILINHVVSNGINTIIIGHNKCWKQEINIGKRNNQNFVSIPFNTFISMISYKATLEGVNVNIVEESYTSKCSFLDNERICKHESYAGRRIKRGLFKTSSGKIINADINGAFNIIRKSAKESFDVTMLPEGRGFWWNPLRISV